MPLCFGVFVVSEERVIFSIIYNLCFFNEHRKISNYCTAVRISIGPRAKDGFWNVKATLYAGLFIFLQFVLEALNKAGLFQCTKKKNKPLCNFLLL